MLSVHTYSHQKSLVINYFTQPALTSKLLTNTRQERREGEVGLDNLCQARRAESCGSDESRVQGRLVGRPHKGSYWKGYTGSGDGIGSVHGRDDERRRCWTLIQLHASQSPPFFLFLAFIGTLPFSTCTSIPRVPPVLFISIIVYARYNHAHLYLHKP